MLVVCSGTSGPRLASRTSARLSSCSTRATSPSVSTPRSTPRWPSVSSRSGGCARATRAGSRSTSTSLLLPMPRSQALILIALLCSYIVAAALDGGTQVISFILNFAVFGASGTAHNFPEWWGNGTSHLPPRSSTDITDCLPLPCAVSSIQISACRPTAARCPRTRPRFGSICLSRPLLGHAPHCSLVVSDLFSLVFFGVPARLHE